MFDIDGVLIDVSSSYRVAIQKTVEFFTQKSVTPEDIQRLKEKGSLNNDWDLSEALIKERGKSIPKEKIIDKFQYYYWKNPRLIDTEKLLLPKKTLEKIALKHRLGIITGRPREEANYILKKFEIFDLFEAIICMEDCPEGKGKPHPYTIQKALEKMKSDNGVYFGDAVDDMTAAKQAGIIGVGVIPPLLRSGKINCCVDEKWCKCCFEKHFRVGLIIIPKLEMFQHTLFRNPC